MGLLGQWPTQLSRELVILNFPLFQAFGLMDRKGQCAKFLTTNVTDESPWSGWNATGSFLETSRSIRTIHAQRSGILTLWLAASLVNQETIWPECAATAVTREQLGLRTLKCLLVGYLKAIGATATDVLWFEGFWPLQVLGQFAVLNAPLLQALGLMNGNRLGTKFSATDVAYPEPRPAGWDHRRARLVP